MKARVAHITDLGVGTGAVASEPVGGTVSLQGASCFTPTTAVAGVQK